MSKRKFEHLDLSLFEPLEQMKMKMIKGGGSTLLQTHCRETASCCDDDCGDSEKDEDVLMQS